MGYFYPKMTENHPPAPSPQSNFASSLKRILPPIFYAKNHFGYHLLFIGWPPAEFNCPNVYPLGYIQINIIRKL